MRSIFAFIGDIIDTFIELMGDKRWFGLTCLIALPITLILLFSIFQPPQENSDGHFVKKKLMEYSEERIVKVGEKFPLEDMSGHTPQDEYVYLGTAKESNSSTYANIKVSQKQDDGSLKEMYMTGIQGKEIEPIHVRKSEKGTSYHLYFVESHLNSIVVKMGKVVEKYEYIEDISLFEWLIR
ncbi:hypothetical protein [Rossellomorea marisflavi]|uniref:hypothetical protein n=1 Tax=Rossellomorea marisflavi TaxID=189381 RepID=UPI003FA049E3